MRPAALLAMAGLFGCAPPPALAPAPAPAIQPPSGAPAILYFYAYPPVVLRGEPTRICYGVENASAARIDPQPGNVPAYANRCFETSPERTTEYVLSVQGAGGVRRKSDPLKVVVRSPQTRTATRPPKLEPPPGPLITTFTADPPEVPRGTAVSLCYATAGADSVRIEPPVVDFRLPARGCLGHVPERNTTYRLTVSGPGGSQSRQVSVIVR